MGAALIVWHFTGDRAQVIGRLKQSPEFADRWNGYCGLSRMMRAKQPGEGRSWRRISAKKRYIDPLVAGEGRVSDLSSELREKMTAFVEEPQTAWLSGK